MVIDSPNFCMALTRVTIGGIPRCGTTLLGVLLNSQPNAIYIADFLQSFLRLQIRYRTHLCEPLGDRERSISRLVVSDEFAQRGFALWIGIDQFRSLEDLHALVMQQIASPTDVVSGHHSPLVPQHVDRLLEQTTVRVVYMIRDPRDAALSWARRFATEVVRYAEEWREITAAIPRWSKHPRFCAIRYEDLVHSPEQALRPLETLLGMQINPHPKQLLYRRGADQVPWTNNSAFGDVREGIDRRPVGRWQTRSSDPLVRYVSWRCAEGIRSLGYDTQHVGLADSAHFAAHALVHRGGVRAMRSLVGVLSRMEKATFPGERY